MAGTQSKEGKPNQMHDVRFARRLALLSTAIIRNIVYYRVDWIRPITRRPTRRSERPLHLGSRHCAVSSLSRSSGSIPAAHRLIRRGWVAPAMLLDAIQKGDEGCQQGHGL